MHIIIIGGGSVGLHIAKKLIEKKQSVILVEQEEERIKYLRDRVDTNIVQGNGANVDVLEKANIRGASMVIALMKNDDANIVACMLAKTFSKEITTVARVRNPDSAGSIDIDTYGLTKKQVGLDVIISPEKAMAQELVKTILFPDIDELRYFAKEEVKLVGKVISSKSQLNGKRIKDFELPSDARALGIAQANGAFIFLSGEEILQEGDKIYLLGAVEAIRSVSKMLYEKESKIKRVLILGGGIAGFALAQELESARGHSFRIKIIETDAKRSEELTNLLKKTIVIQGDGTDRSYFNTEEIQEADILISVTGDDRTNLIATMMAKRLGVGKVINALADMEYAAMYTKMGVNTVVDPQYITAEKILRYVHKEEVLSLAVLEEDVEVFEVIVEEGCPVVNKTIREVGFPKEMRIGAIVRKDTYLSPDAEAVLESKDHVVIIALGKTMLELERFFRKGRS